MFFSLRRLFHKFCKLRHDGFFGRRLDIDLLQPRRYLDLRLQRGGDVDQRSLALSHPGRTLFLGRRSVLKWNDLGNPGL